MNITDCQCTDSTNQIDIIITTMLGYTPFNPEIVGVNGFDESPINIPGWYSIYAIGDSLQTNSSGFIGSVREIPILPDGYDVYRRINKIYLDTNKNISF